MRQKSSMLATLKNLKGNPKACVFTEPLWGIPFNLYMPYATLYMSSLGVTDQQIGFLASLGMVFQVMFALLSGAITDKLGRKKTTFIFDVTSWSIPCLVWAFAQDFRWFAVAAVINSVWRVTMNSWTCLLVEDAQERQLVDIWSWVHISGLLAAFFAPLAGLLIAWNGLVPTVRILYLTAFVLMTAKFITLNIYAKETQQGRIRRQETQDQTIIQLLAQYGGVFRQLLRSPQTLLTMGILMVMSVCVMVNNAFWPLYITNRLAVPVEFVGAFPFIRSLIMLGFYFFVVPRFNPAVFGRPMLTGFSMFVTSQLLLIFSPPLAYSVLFVSVLLEAGALAMINPMMDALLVTTVDRQERARIMAIIWVVIILLTSPFGWLAGFLSEISRTLPFVMNICLFFLGGVFTYLASQRAVQDVPSEMITVQERMI